MTYTRLLRIAATFFQAATLYDCSGSDFSPVAAHASTITSGLASATCASLTFSPAGTIISPPQMSTISATHGGELILGLGQASQYTRGRSRPNFFTLLARSESPALNARIKRSALAAFPAIPPNNRISV